MFKLYVNWLFLAHFYIMLSFTVILSLLLWWDEVDGNWQVIISIVMCYIPNTNELSGRISVCVTTIVKPDKDVSRDTITCPTTAQTTRVFFLVLSKP